ncbi:urea amidolyase [Methylobacterium sp. Leaf104]|uniref:5-oxoprolinase subunit C family protein n=1 Tax=Methylobacterium TaxID=407 RepID=UPI0006F2A39B|nr:biotin-dependent carboxyltransferase family protein [Methylobacterium sp. Leaf104]KQP29917.1 urea amidolyase [Methylobacterium sp. Leaf104]MCI9882389.1 biotin-dependent carboxyltransferase family protein [Methylobacterium goesingense]
MTAEATLRILTAGGGVSLQDAGRHGFLRYGITPAGPMDPLAHATANRALDNPLSATAVEVSLGGLALTVAEAAVDVALAGGDLRIDLDGRPLPSAVALTLRPGARLTLRAGQTGAWCSLAVGGEIAVAAVLGSTATHTRSGLGGLRGRGLEAGDSLPVAHPRASVGEPARLAVPWLHRPPEVIRVVWGPQDDLLEASSRDAFLAGPWRIGPRGDRMACFLEGPAIRARTHDIVSDGIAMGSIQVPGSGQPLVLMADRQPTGGYPKIATVIGADLGRLAQARTGTRLRFAAVEIAEAVAARRAEREALVPAIARQPVLRTDFPSEFLLGTNLIGGVVG